MTTLSDHERSWAELVSLGGTIGYAIEHLHFRSEEEYVELRELTTSFTSRIGVPSATFPETRAEYREKRSVIIDEIVEALQRAQEPFEDASPLAFFRLVVFSVEAAARIALDVPAYAELGAVRQNLTDLGLDPGLSEALERDADAIPVADETETDGGQIRLSNLWLTVRSFVGRVLDEWLKTSSLAPHAAQVVNLFVNRVDALDIKEVAVVQQNKTVTIGAHATINAPVTVADSIQNSFNALNEASIDDEMRKLLEDLAHAVVEAAGSASPELAQTMARDTETLTKELTSDEPRRQWWQLSLESLKDAAVTIGAAAAPILEIAAKIAALL